jgi:S-adenosylmethionine:tRNA ribosyltransferase-isomerase
VSALARAVPALSEAGAPPETRGLARDAVRLLAVSVPDGGMRHARFSDLPNLLRPGDLVVINTSGTLAAALAARRTDGSELTLHLSTPLPGDGGDHWVVEPRDGHHVLRDGRAGEQLALPGGAKARLLAPYLGTRLWVAALRLPEPLEDYLAHHGRPIQYRHLSGDRPLADFQTVYATEPGSAEMPSAGRPFTAELVTRLVASGIDIAPLVLHAGVSSLEQGERPYPERYRVPESTAQRVRLAHRLGGRVVAVGTTVVRALESATDAAGGVHAADGWTSLVLGPDTGVRAVDGILTGFHDPDASHLDLLEALAPREVVARSYRVAADAGYLRHEFGDLQLLLRRASSLTIA